MKKVKVKSSWTSDENIFKRLITQFKTSEKDVDNIEFVSDDSYDIIIFFGYITEELLPNKKGVVFPQEPSWSGNHQRNFPINQSITVYGYDKNLYNIPDLVFENVSLMFYGGRGPWTEGYSFWTYQNIINKTFIKKKNISSVVSSLGSDGNYGPDSCLYKERSTLISELIKRIEFIDFYGWGTEKNNLKGYIPEKKDGLINYKFSLCIENSSEKNYISEKFFDCILTNTIPIYYGCNNVKELIPENCYILIDDIKNIDSVEELLTHINKNCDEIYQNMLPNLLNFKNRYFDDFNPLKEINKLSKLQ